ncbi:MAG: hypothetical protein F6K19_48700 [Cyanothece sp. SIO1E1]|nr:hypothetical protein [Cyanothece sp. SIO1E1]
MVLLQDLPQRLSLNDPEERQIVGNVSWQQYESVLAELADSPFYRVTFW